MACGCRNGKNAGTKTHGVMQPNWIVTLPGGEVIPYVSSMAAQQRVKGVVGASVKPIAASA